MLRKLGFGGMVVEREVDGMFVGLELDGIRSSLLFVDEIESRQEHEALKSDTNIIRNHNEFSFYNMKFYRV